MDGMDNINYVESNFWHCDDQMDCKNLITM